MARRMVDLTDLLLSKSTWWFSGDFKVNVLHSCDREGKRDLQRMGPGDNLSPLRGDG